MHLRSAMLCKRKTYMALTSARTTLVAGIILTFFLQLTYASPSTPWPYMQIYPPVNESDARKPLYFALMLSFGGDYTSIGALPGVQIALDYVNSNPSILPGYSLHYTLTDSRVNVYLSVCFFRDGNARYIRCMYVSLELQECKIDWWSL